MPLIAVAPPYKRFIPGQGLPDVPKEGVLVSDEQDAAIRAIAAAANEPSLQLLGYVYEEASDETLASKAYIETRFTAITGDLASTSASDMAAVDADAGSDFRTQQDLRLSATFAPVAHEHPVTDLGTGTPEAGMYLDGSGAWMELPASGGSGGGSGDITGPAGAVDSRVAAFDTTTGKLLKDAGATVAEIRDRTTHTGTVPSATISDFTEAAQDAVAAMLASGANVTLSYNDAGDSLSITATGPDAEATRDAIGAALVGVGNIAVTVNDAGDTIAISTTATANDTDANLKDRANHTGTQPLSTISGLGTAATVNTGTASGEIPLLSTGGRLPIARIASGTPTGSLFVRDDGVLAVPPTGGAALTRVTWNSATSATYVRNTTTATDIDATNLAATFTPNGASVRFVAHLPMVETNGTAIFGLVSLRQGSTDVVGTERMMANASSASGRQPGKYDVILTGLTPGVSVTMKLAGRAVSGSFTITYGGSSTEFTGTTFSYGPIVLEVFDA